MFVQDGTMIDIYERKKKKDFDTSGLVDDDDASAQEEG